MPQLSYSAAPAKAHEGMVADSGIKDLITKTNNTNQRTDVTIENAVNDAVYKIVLTDGNGDSDTATFTASESTSMTEVRDGLIDEVNGLGLAVTAAAAASDTISLIGSDNSGAFTAASTGSDTPEDLTFETVIEAGQEISFGRVVCYDGDHGDKYCRLPRQEGDIGGDTLGVSASHVSQEPNDNGLADKSSVSILNKGRIWMRTEDAVTLGDDVYVRYTTNGEGKVPGQVRSDDDTNTAAQLTRAKFASSADAGELVLVELS